MNGTNKNIPTFIKRQADILWMTEIPPSKRQLISDDTCCFITLTIKDNWAVHANGFKQNNYLKIGKHTKLAKLFIDYANYRGVDVTSFDFFFKAKILNWSDTISSCGMKDYDTIDCVHLVSFTNA